MLLKMRTMPPKQGRTAVAYALSSLVSRVEGLKVRLCPSRPPVAFASAFAVQSNLSRGEVLIRSAAKRIAFLCLLLTMWSAVAVTAHHHASSSDAAKCTVCVAAHSAAPTITSTLTKAIFVRLNTLRAEPVSASHRLIAFALSVRPPPAV